MISGTIFGLLFLHSVTSAGVCNKEDASDGLYIQRQKTKNPLSYDPERTPSYCDRIVLGSINNLKSEVQVYEYSAITDEYIDYSDHDLVYGYFSFDGMNILAITWNVGKFVSKADIKKQSAWDDILCSLKTSLTKHMQRKKASAKDAETKVYPSWDEIDIIAFGFQETKWPFKLSYLTTSLKKSFTDREEVWHEIIAHEGPRISARNTYLYILYNKNSVFHSKKHRIVEKIIFDQGNGVKKSFKKLFRTKSAVIIGRFRKIKMKDGKMKISNKFIAFGNAHLPVDTKNKKDWGVEIREIGMNYVEYKFEERFNKNDNDDGLIAFMGDLNFRVIHPNDPEKRFEQLERYLNDKGMKKKNVGYWKELMDVEDTETGERRFLPTCKRETGSWRKQMKKVIDTAKSGVMMEDVKGWIERVTKQMKKVIDTAKSGVMMEDVKGWIERVTKHMKSLKIKLV